MIKNELLALILARGGSKGLPNKNIKSLNGKPLLYYTIEVAKKSKYIDRLVLSTDDDEIAEVGERYGSEVPFIRPKELAEDDTSSVETMVHAINWLKNNDDYNSDYVMLLQPTSPLRIVEDVDSSYEKLIDKGADSIVGLTKSDKHPYWMMKIENDEVIPWSEKREEFTRRQDLPNVYEINGAIYITKTNLFLENKKIMARRTVPYIMPKDRSVDIDTEFDFKFAEYLMKKRE